MHKRILLLMILLFNTSYGMESESGDNNTSPLALQITKYNSLLNQDLETTSNNIKTVTLGWTDSKKFAYGSLASVGICACSCLAPDEMKAKMLGLGTTLLLGNGALTLATMLNEKNKLDIYVDDETKVNKSIEALKQTISKVTHQADAKGNSNQTLNTTTVSTTQQINAHNIELIQTCNGKYEKDINRLNDLIAEYPISRVCLYSTLAGVLLCAIAWLNRNNKDAAQFAGMGSILFFGAGGIGLMCANNENKILKQYIDTKISTRESIMEINRS